MENKPTKATFAWTALEGPYPAYVNLNGNRLTVREETQAFSTRGRVVGIDLPDEVLDALRVALAGAYGSHTSPSVEGGEALEAEAVAQAFHEAYERLAPSFGYETRKASAKPWSDVPEQNKGLMIAVAGEVCALLSSKRKAIAA